MRFSTLEIKSVTSHSLVATKTCVNSEHVLLTTVVAGDSADSSSDSAQEESLRLKQLTCRCPLHTLVSNRSSWWLFPDKWIFKNDLHMYTAHIQCLLGASSSPSDSNQMFDIAVQWYHSSKASFIYPVFKEQFCYIRKDLWSAKIFVIKVFQWNFRINSPRYQSCQKTGVWQNSDLSF